MENVTFYPNITDMNITNISLWTEDIIVEESYIEVFVTILVITALIAMIVNVIVFSSVYWIRRPMPPILKMSISLAAADGLTSPIFAITLYINTYLPMKGINVKLLQIIMEMIRLSGILITVTHLLALSVNHYLGILKPLHYNSIVTRRKVTMATVLMWICPTLYIIFLFTFLADEDYWQDYDYNENFNNESQTTSDEMNSNKTTFYDTFLFRMSYSSYFFISIFLMVICYTHILIIVRRQQNTWKHLSRVGSTKWAGRNTKGCSTTKAHKEQRQLEGNIRAIYTTLLILGSCVIGWMPALFIFILMCKEDCCFNGEELETLNKDYSVEVRTMRLVENMLVLLKMLANPIIYTIRMKEIQEGTKHMKQAFARIFCPSRPDSRNYILANRQSGATNTCNSSFRTRLTTSINSGNNIGRTELVNTLL